MNTTTAHPSAIALVSLALRDDRFLDRFDEERVWFTGAAQRAVEAMKTISALHGAKPDLLALRQYLKSHPDALSVIEDARCVDVSPSAYAMHKELLRADQIKFEVFALAARYNALNDPFERESPEAVLNRLMDEVTELRERIDIGKEQTLRDSKGMVDAFLDEVKNRSRWPISTGFEFLDEATGGGFRPGQMVVLGAYTGVGKSAMLCAMASHMAKSKPATERTREKPAVPVLIVSIEMTCGEVEARIVSHETQIQLSDLATESKIDELASWKQRLLATTLERHRAEGRVFCDDCADVTPQRLRALIRRQVRVNQVKVVFIDYIQLVKAERRDSRVQELDELSREMKVIAKELDVVVVCLAQLNRTANTEGRKPKLSDLRESGGLEANANTVILLSRREEEDPEKAAMYEENRQIPVLIQLAKNRSGMTGEVNMVFQGKNMTYLPA